MANGNGNGNFWRLVLGGGTALTVLSLAFWTGTTFQKLEAHVSEREKHQTVIEKSRHIDDRVMLRIEPIKAQLREIDRKLERLIEREEARSGGNR